MKPSLLPLPYPLDRVDLSVAFNHEGCPYDQLALYAMDEERSSVTSMARELSKPSKSASASLVGKYEALLQVSESHAAKWKAFVSHAENARSLSKASGILSFSWSLGGVRRESSVVRFESACVYALCASVHLCLGELKADVGEKFFDHYARAHAYLAREHAREVLAWTVADAGPPRPFECTQRSSAFFRTLCLASLQARAVDSAKIKCTSPASTLPFQLAYWGWKAARRACRLAAGAPTYLEVAEALRDGLHAQTLLTAARHGAENGREPEARACLDALKSSGTEGSFAPRGTLLSSAVSRVTGRGSQSKVESELEESEKRDREILADLKAKLSSFESASEGGSFDPSWLPKEEGFFYKEGDMSPFFSAPEGFAVKTNEALDALLFEKKT